MAIRDLFSNNKALTSKDLNKSTLTYEDPSYLYVNFEERKKFKPYVDYSNPYNFCFYALAEKYYEDAFDRISNTYPYDGSILEKKKWLLSSSNFDLYVLENLYPRTNGYVSLGSAWSINSTDTLGSTIYAEATTPEYIKIRQQMNTGSISDGGMTDVSVNFSASNYYDVSKNRDSNLEFNLNNGITTEFWFKHGAQISSPTEVIFDLWNGQDSGSSDYGRFTLETTGSISGTVNFLVTAQSGSDGIFQQSLGSITNITDWNHYAIRVVNSGSSLNYELFVNGNVSDTQTAAASSIENVTGSLTAVIGALNTAPSGSTTLAEGWGSVSGSFDEFRFWKTEKSHEDIGRFYFTNVEAGTNTNDSETELGFYYKFNEGVTQTGSIDSIVLDYSGRTTNGTIVNYQSGSRSTSSAIVEASAADDEFLDPIIWNFHPTVRTQKAFWIASGSSYDFQNNSSLYNSVPGWVQEEDLGEWKNLSQIMGAYFDQLHLLIKEVPKLKNIQYPSGSDKPYPIAPQMLQHVGIDPIDLFNDVSSLESLYNRDEDRNFESSLSDIKNSIFINIYNNVVDLYKQKGTITALRNLFHCFGIDEKLLHINVYADNEVYEIRQNFTPMSIKKKYADFNNVDRFGSTIYQQTSSLYPESLGYVYGSGVTRDEALLPITMEAEVVFPKKPDHSLSSWASSSFSLLTSSLFGVHTPITGSGIDETTWETGSIADMQVYAVRDSKYSENVYFVCQSSTPGTPLPTLTSSLIEEVYDNQKWNLAVKVYPTKLESAGLASGSASGSNTYTVEFYGVSTVLDTVVNEFNVTGTMSWETGAGFVSAPKRFYVGAHRQDFNGSVLEYSDVKVGNLRYWSTYLENDTIKEHNIDSENYGNNYSHIDRYTTINGLDFKNVMDSELLALDWSFDTITGSDTNGEFIVADVTSGTADFASRYSWLGSIVGNQYPGLAFNFPSSDLNVTDVVYQESGKYTPVEQVSSNDMIQIFESDRLEQIQDARPIQYVVSIEKNMYQNISNEMVEWLGTVKEFDNLIGEPIHAYHLFYKGLEQLRQLFFEHVENTPDFDKFLGLYKWVDSSLSSLIAQFIPASAKSDKRVRTVIESHVLERPKVWRKWPTLEFAVPEPNSPIWGINRQLYPWKFGHHPVSGLESDNQFYWKNRALREDFSSGDDEVDQNRAKYLSASLERLTRNYSNPYKLTLEKDVLDKDKTAYNFFKGSGIDSNSRKYAWTSNGNIDQLQDVNDVLNPLEKKKYTFKVFSGNESADSFIGDLVFPLQLISASVSGGISDYIVNQIGLNVDFGSTMHNEFYGDFNQNPMQGPFTNHTVGGYKTSHQSVNYNLDGPDSRIENKYVVLEPDNQRIGVYDVGTENVENDAAGQSDISTTDWPKERFYRDHVAKSPYNVRNIKHTSSSPTIIGNYSHEYEVVQAAGRLENNYWFRDFTGSLAPSAEIKNVRESTENEFKDFEIPDRTLEDGNRQKTAIVERFSSPGGPEQSSLGYLDPVSETRSIYNSINYRHLNLKKYIQNQVQEGNTSVASSTTETSLAVPTTDISVGFRETPPPPPELTEFPVGFTFSTEITFHNNAQVQYLAGSPYDNLAIVGIEATVNIGDPLIAAVEGPNGNLLWQINTQNSGEGCYLFRTQAWKEDGSVYVSYRLTGSNFISKRNARTGEELAVVTLSRTPQDLFLSPDGSVLYSVTKTNAYEIRRYDADDLTFLTNHHFRGGSTDYGTTYTPTWGAQFNGNGDTLFFADNRYYSFGNSNNDDPHIFCHKTIPPASFTREDTHGDPYINLTDAIGFAQKDPNTAPNDMLVGIYPAIDGDGIWMRDSNMYMAYVASDGAATLYDPIGEMIGGRSKYNSNYGMGMCLDKFGHIYARARDTSPSYGNVVRLDPDFNFVAETYTDTLGGSNTGYLFPDDDGNHFVESYGNIAVDGDGNLYVGSSAAGGALGDLSIFTQG